MAGTATLAVSLLVGAPPLAAAVKAVKVPRAAGLAGPPMQSDGAFIADFNGDGLPDVLLNHHYRAPLEVMLNTGARFQRLDHPRFKIRDPHGCDSADVDADGRADFYCSAGGRGGGRGPNSNGLWLQREPGKFVEQTRAWKARDLYGRGREVAFLDANGDGRADLFVGNAQPRKDGRRGANKLLINKGGKRFAGSPKYGVNKPIGGHVARAADYNADGRDDLLVCGSGKRLHLYKNVRHKRFRDVARYARARVQCLDAVLARMNGGRRLDLVVLTNRRVIVRLQRKNGRFQRQPAFSYPIRHGRAIAVGDSNGDGKGDIYVVRGGPFPEAPAQEIGDKPWRTDKPDVMLVSKKEKRNAWRKQRIPQTRQGSGESVTAIDYDGNGLDDYVVMNGYRRAIGPTLLIAFRRTGG